MSKGSVSRRRFLQGCAAAGAAGAAMNVFPGRVLGANERVNIGIIGMGGKGGAHFKDFSKLANVEIVAVCDPDEDRMRQAGEKREKFQDMRKLLEMKDIDAVVIATPDHWHCLAAIWAMQAGKHAYVEKPVSRHIWEGRKMVEAARKYNRIVQTGTQQRSCPATQECAKDIREGAFGKVKWVHCSKLGAREPIGKVNGPQPLPRRLDYNIWAGPGPMAPIVRRNFHYDWHWLWDWGTGEMGNWGVHYLDDVRHILGWDDVPDNVQAAGNRWWDDDGETPNIHICYAKHRGVDLVIDIRHMADPARGGKEGPVYLGSRGGNYIMCEDAYIKISRGGGKVYDAKTNKSIKQYAGTGGSGHDQNFIDAVRAGSNESLACEIEVGHMSTTLCHLANIAYRVGVVTPVDEVKETFKGHQDAADTIESMLAQLKGCGVDLEAKPFIMGPKLNYDVKTETFQGECADMANQWVKIASREPFVVPEEV